MLLDNMLKVWNNLESSYDNVNKAHSISRWDFLLKAIAYRDTLETATLIRGQLSTEYKLYNSEQTQSYNELIEKIEKVYSYAVEVKKAQDSDAIPEISNLDDFVDGILSLDSENDDESFSVEDYNLMMPEVFCSVEYVLSKGFLVDTVCEEDGAVSVLRVDTQDPDYRVFYSVEQLTVYLQNSELVDNRDVSVNAAALYLLMNYESELTYPVVFVSSKYCEVDNNSLVIGGRKLNVSLSVDSEQSLRRINSTVKVKCDVAKDNEFGVTVVALRG